MHRKAEDTHLPAGSFDVVSMCLVAHELPQHATKAILREAYRCASVKHRHPCSRVGHTLPRFSTMNNKHAIGAATITEPSWLSLVWFGHQLCAKVCITTVCFLQGAEAWRLHVVSSQL